jgi:hypothetical protein
LEDKQIIYIFIWGVDNIIRGGEERLDKCRTGQKQVSIHLQDKVQHTVLLLLYLAFEAVPGEHVLDVVEEVTDGVHEGQMLTVLVHSLQHLMERHSNLRFTT